MPASTVKNVEILNNGQNNNRHILVKMNRNGIIKTDSCYKI